jgi:hypothetical protein
MISVNMNPFPVNHPSSDTRIYIKHAVAEGIKEYKDKHSSACMNTIGIMASLALTITILVFTSTILKDVTEIKNKIGA